MPFDLQPTIEDAPVNCLCCGPIKGHLCKEHRIAVGFGSAALLKDGQVVWSERHEMEYSECMSVEEAEILAVADPDHDWRIALHGPLQGRVYQRQGTMKWMLIATDNGFA